jgi:alpha-galactosidase
MVQQAAVLGALRKDRELIYHALILDPNTASVACPEEIRAMVDEMFTAQKKWLGWFDK